MQNNAAVLAGALQIPLKSEGNNSFRSGQAAENTMITGADNVSKAMY